MFKLGIYLYQEKREQEELEGQVLEGAFFLGSGSSAESLQGGDYFQKFWHGIRAIKYVKNNCEQIDSN